LVDSASFSEGSDRSHVVLQLGIDLLTTVGQEVDGMTKRRWAQSLFDLQARAQAAGPITSLILAWGLELCENGTIGQCNLARSTVRQYFRCAALPLFEALRLVTQRGDERGWSTEDLRATYVGLIAVQSIGSKKTMASALTSFHNFLSEWFDLEPMAMQLHDNVPMARVQAQVIWPHEVEQVMSWLQLVDDERVRNAAMIIVDVAHEKPSRTAEMLRWRLANIREGRDELSPYMEIEIARRAVSARLKTPAAQRRLTIRDPVTITLINNWVKRRTDEGAPIDSFLFGDPNNDSRLYRPGAVASLINRLLKAATGEADSRIHWLRHSAINTNVGGHLDSASTTDINRIAIAATEAGHASAVSTFKSYFHLYETSLRSYLNAALLDLIKVTSAQAAPHLNLKSNTLRQHASRHSMPVEEYIWSQLRQMPISPPLMDVAEPYGWQAPVMPKLLPRAKLAVTVAVARSWLEELLDGAGAEVLALRFGIAIETLEMVTRDTMSFCLHLARSAWPRRFAMPSPPPADLGHALGMAEIDLSRAHQSKFRRLEDWFSVEQPLPVLRHAHASWLACRQGGYIALCTSGQILGLYQLLASAKVDPRDLRLCIQASLNAAGQQLPLQASQKVPQELARAVAIEDFMTVFGVPPRESLQQTRLGRPPVYLQWDDPAHRQEPSSASSSCAGLDSWMCAAAALLSMKEGQS
jgi:integrase